MKGFCAKLINIIGNGVPMYYEYNHVLLSSEITLIKITGLADNVIKT